MTTTDYYGLALTAMVIIWLVWRLIKLVRTKL